MTDQLPYRERLALIRQGLAAKTTGAKPKKQIPRQSPKKLAEIKMQKEMGGDGDSDLQRFFKRAMSKMTSHCLNCHNRTETKVYSAAIFSIAHILDKRDTMFPSVKDNIHNWVELCPDCHREFDTTPMEKDKTLWDKRQAMGIWEVVWAKLLKVYPSILPEELHHLPTELRERIEKTLNQ